MHELKQTQELYELSVLSTFLEGWRPSRDQTSQPEQPSMLFLHINLTDLGGLLHLLNY